MGVFVALQVRMSLSIDENEDVLQYWINDEERRRLDVSRSVRSFEVCHEGVVTSRPNGPRCVFDGSAASRSRFRRAPWFGDLGTIGNVSWVKKACKLD